MTRVQSNKLAAAAQLRQGDLDKAQQLLDDARRLAPDDAEVHFMLAATAATRGALDDAVACCREAVRLRPDYREAVNALGEFLARLGRLDEAIRCYRDLAARSPSAFIHFSLANMLMRRDLSDEALVHYRRALELEPRRAEIHNNLGNAFRHRGEYRQAEQAYMEALRLRPDHPAAHEGYANLGAVQLLLNRAADARASYDRALMLNPGFKRAIAGHAAVLERTGQYTAAYTMLQPLLQEDEPEVDAVRVFATLCRHVGRADEGIALAQRLLERSHPPLEIHDRLALYLGLSGTMAAAAMFDEAAAVLADARDLAPRDPRVHHGLGCLRVRQERYDEAVAAFGEAIRLRADYAPAFADRGLALRASGDLDEAIRDLRRATELDPGMAEACNALAQTLRRCNRLQEAEQAIKQALQIDADSAAAHYTLADVYHAQGRIGDAIAETRRVLTLEPGNVRAQSALLMCMEHLPEFSADHLFTATREWAAGYAHLSEPPRVFPNERSPQRRLRVGYVSADLHEHPVGFYLERLLAHRDGAAHEIYCYCNSTVVDALTRRLRDYADCWRVIADHGDEDVDRLIREDGIDILVDLSGHGAENRLPVFARRPAPVQATWMGYFDTTGLPAVDYILADRFVIPEGREQYYVEEVARLPGCYMIFAPPDCAGEVSPLPALATGTGTVTFGCFNNNAKITGQVADWWTGVLQAVPRSRLFLKSAAYADPAVAARYRGLFAAHGVPEERVLMEGFSPRPELLRAYGRVDIALDPFPYNGGLTTFEALWMGVPVISLRGERYVNRVGDSILSTAGVREWVADTREEYISKAAALAADHARLAGLRAALRDRVEKSPLCDGAAFARAAESAYRRMWTTWCARQS